MSAEYMRDGRVGTVPTVQELAEGVRVVELRTPTLPPATATNTLVVGNRRLAVIEPATPYAEERADLDAVLGALGGEVVAILLTHHHVDHIGYAEELRARTGAPIYAHAETASAARIRGRRRAG
jgi:ribonuclease/clavin/mitogillin